MIMTNHYDYLVVGAGLFGSAFAYKANKAGKHCLVIDRRPQVGGNLYCADIEGIHVHQYGAHIFHTSNWKVWNFVNSLVDFNRYTNSPVANYKGRLFNLPFNMNTFYQMWGVTTPAEAEAKLEEEKAEMRAKLESQHISEPRNLEEQAQLLIGKSIYETLIKGYTEKQWGRKCTELPAFIIRRLPVRLVFDNNYFNDAYQGIPIGGYNVLIDKLLEGSETIVGVDFFHVRQRDGEGRILHEVVVDGQKISFDKLVYTGQIDEYFDFRLGKLNFRTVRFETEVLDTSNYQGNAVVNYTDADVPYTRVIEHKHFESFGPAVYENPKTVISREYSSEWQDGMEPYYPVNDEANNLLAQRYRELAAEEKDVIFGGRLAEYKYYDMAPLLEKVLEMNI
jgi:UDP-galactopyranose mutase